MTKQTTIVVIGSLRVKEKNLRSKLLSSLSSWQHRFLHVHVQDFKLNIFKPVFFFYDMAQIILYWFRFQIIRVISGVNKAATTFMTGTVSNDKDVLWKKGLNCPPSLIL